MGIAAVLYSAYRLAAFVNVYLRPSSLEKYLSNGAYAVVTGRLMGSGKPRLWNSPEKASNSFTWPE